jgi:GTP-binding protein
VSGIHGTGLGDMLDELTTKHMKKVTNVMKENATNIALMDRPNVGKSSLFNRLDFANSVTSFSCECVMSIFQLI